MHRGSGDALAIAVELAVTPAIFALAGWRLDEWVGTTPLFLIAFFALVMAYEIWKLFGRYDAQMRAEERKLLGKKDGQG